MPSQLDEVQQGIDDLSEMNKEQIHDGYHSFKELYEFRKLYHAAFLVCYKYYDGSKAHKSLRHSDGELCFGGGWFIVVCYTNKGQISNHYKMEDWDLFAVEEREKADEWDGHTSQDVLERLTP